MDMDSDRENGQSGDRKTVEDEAPLSKGALIRKKLMLVAGYMMDGFAPVVAVIALIVAVMAFNGNKSGQTIAGQSSSRLEIMSVSLTTTKGELEKLKATLLKDKAMQDEERKKLDERLAKTIQAISQLQAKAKVSPTLEEQLSQPGVKAAVTNSSTSTVTAASAPEKKTGEQVKVLKDAIEKFNKK